MGLNSSHFGLSPCFGLQFAMGFNHSHVGPQIVMNSKSHQLCTCPWSSTCSLDSPQSLSPVFILAFPLPQSSALVLGSHFAVAFPGPASHQLVSTLHSASPPWSLASALLSWSDLFFSRVLPLSSGSCSLFRLLFHGAASPFGLCSWWASQCVPLGQFQWQGRMLCCVCLSVLPCWVLRGWWGCAVLAVPRASGTI